MEGYAGAWQQAIAETAAAHGEGVVMVDGHPVPGLVDHDEAWIGPIAARKVRENESVVIRSGGTLFSAPSEVRNRVREATWLHHAVVELPLGSFDFTPSRESAIATDRTLAAIETALDAYHHAYATLAARVESLAANNVYAAIRLRSKVLGRSGRRDKHLPIKFILQLPKGSGTWRRIGNGCRRSRWVNFDLTDSVDEIEALDIDREMGQTLVVTDVPAKRVVRGFAKWLADEHHDVHRVVTVPEGSSHLVGPVVTAQGSATNQTWHIGADTTNIVTYTFTQLQEQLTARRLTRSAVSGYACVVTGANGDAEHQELAGQEIAALGLPVWYVESDGPVRPRATTSASVGVYLGRRKVEPLLRAVPGATTFYHWNGEQTANTLAAMSREELISAVSRYSGSQLPGLATSVVAQVGPQHPLIDALTALAAYRKEAVCDITDAQMRAFRAAAEASKEVATSALRELNDLKQRFAAAYPLVKNHGVHYVRHTPPMAG